MARAMARRARLVHSPEYECEIGVHVFPTRKYRLIREAMIAGGEAVAEDFAPPPPATRAELLLVHTPEYLDDLEQARWTPRTRLSELPISPGIIRAYVLAAGGTTLAARQALNGRCGVHVGGGFHHAFADRAEGFCYLNDLAVAVRTLQHEGAIRRAAIVDCDVHQGNGTARLFAGDETVFTFSIHQENLYPVKETSDLDIGLADGVGDDEYLARLAEGLEGVWAHRPDLVLYQAGADPFERDLLGGLRLTHAGLERRDRLVLEGCGARGIPAVVTLGGGYAADVRETVAIHRRTCGIGLAVAGDGAAPA